MYKVFFNERAVYLTDNLDHLTINKKGFFYPFTSFDNLKSFIEKFKKNPTIPEVFIYHDDLEALITEFKSLNEFIEAAGGLVLNEKKQILFIKRHGKWDLPKGKPEKDESIENTAIREVEEECGITNIAIKDVLYSSYHTYNKNDREYLKKTHWFTMYYEGNEELKPQEEEGITFAKWFDQNNINDILINTYPLIIDVLKMANIIKKKKRPRFN